MAQRLTSIALLISLLFSVISFDEKRLPDYEYIIEQMVSEYADNGESAQDEIDELMGQLRVTDPARADKWESIMDYWMTVDQGVDMNEGVLPDGLTDTSELCIVVLGFELNPDGSMKNELIERLNVALASALKYPNALIVCTGGGTAYYNPTVTEADSMAEWLIENGIASERIVIENRSMSTAQNAINTYRILMRRYPRVDQIAVITSDYHISTGLMLFQAQATLLSDGPGLERYTIVSNAVYCAPTGEFPPSWQAAALLELMGNIRMARSHYV